MSLFQTLCLLLFNEGDVFTFKEIKLATAIGKSWENIAIINVKVKLILEWFHIEDKKIFLPFKKFSHFRGGHD